MKIILKDLKERILELDKCLKELNIKLDNVSIEFAQGTMNVYLPEKVHSIEITGKFCQNKSDIEILREYGII